MTLVFAMQLRVIQTYNTCSVKHVEILFPTHFWKTNWGFQIGDEIEPFQKKSN